MAIADPIHPDVLTQLIQEEVQRAVTDAIKEVEEQAAKQLAEKVAATADAIALKVMSHYSVERMAGELVIRVHKDV